MAQVFRIADSAGSVTYDFLTGVLKPRANTWTTTPTGDGLVQETFELVGEASDANIMSAIQTIDELTEECDLFWSNDLYSDSIWFEYSATSETAKRALIHDITLTPIARGQYQPILGGTAAFYAMTISRSEAWEDRTTTTISLSDVGALGGANNIAAQKGSLPARISYVELIRLSDNIDKVWCGIRPIRYGVTSFNSSWQCENGTNWTDTSDAVDATASAGNKVVCDFSTDTSLVQRFNVTVDDVCADTNYNHFIGRYLILIRAKLTAAGNCGIQLRYQWDPNVKGSSAISQAGETKYITSTSWNLYELGEVSIPPWSHTGRLSSYDVRNFALLIYAEQNSGTPSLDMDCIILIPSEHMFSGIAGMKSAGTRAEMITNEKWNNYLVGATTATQGDLSDTYSTRNWYLPVEGGQLVVAGQNTTSSTYDDQIGLGDMFVYLRHRTHREA